MLNKVKTKMRKSGFDFELTSCETRISLNLLNFLLGFRILETPKRIESLIEINFFSDLLVFKNKNKMQYIFIG